MISGIGGALERKRKREREKKKKKDEEDGIAFFDLET